jgi:Rod binding domain-containing protein
MEVEAIFLGQLLEQMRRALVEPISPTSQELRGYISLADKQLARALAAGGGLGLAKKILEQLAPLESEPQQENHHEGNSSLPGGTPVPAGDLPVSTTP